MSVCECVRACVCLPVRRPAQIFHWVLGLSLALFVVADTYVDQSLLPKGTVDFLDSNLPSLGCFERLTAPYVRGAPSPRESRRRRRDVFAGPPAVGRRFRKPPAHARTPPPPSYDTIVTILAPQGGSETWAGVTANLPQLAEAAGSTMMDAVTSPTVVNGNHVLLAFVIMAMVTSKLDARYWWRPTHDVVALLSMMFPTFEVRW